MTRMKSLIKKIKFALKLFPYGNNERVKKNINDILSINSMVELVDTHNASRIPKAVYWIRMEKSNSGFFADFIRLLGLLAFADYNNMQPVVEFDEGFCYAEKHPVNGSSNPFEYYFNQPTQITLDSMKNYSPLLKCRKENCFVIGELFDIKNAYEKSEDLLREYGRIIKKYISFNDTVKDYLDNQARLWSSNEKVLGVHVRGTDFKQGLSGHPIIVDREEYLKESLKHWNTGKYSLIFLATDDSEALQLYKNQFGKSLVYYTDVVRSDGDESVMNSSSRRENHHYLLGLEVLRDMYTLSKCSCLVAGLSNVSYTARMFKYSYGQQYDAITIINNGIKDKAH